MRDCKDALITCNCENGCKSNLSWYEGYRLVLYSVLDKPVMSVKLAYTCTVNMEIHRIDIISISNFPSTKQSQWQKNQNKCQRCVIFLWWIWYSIIYYNSSFYELVPVGLILDLGMPEDCESLGTFIFEYQYTPVRNWLQVWHSRVIDNRLLH